MTDRRFDIDTDIAILGAGPTGLEAALAASETGRRFTLFEASSAVAGHIQRWRHVRLFTPWSMNASPRMRQALAAAGTPVPEDETCPTGGALIDRLLAPVAALPAVAGHIQLNTTVHRVARAGLLKNQAIGTPERSEAPFRLLLRQPGGQERVVTARTVIDCTGNVFPTHLGNGGIPALGEEAATGWIEHDVPDVDRDRDRWAGQRVLLIGAGHSAQTAARDLSRLATEVPSTSITWSIRNPQPSWGAVEDDPLPDRAALGSFAADVAAQDRDGPIRFLPGTLVDALEPRADHVTVRLQHSDGGTSTMGVDRVLALTGRVGNDRLYRQLQVHECYATSGPMKLAAALLGASGASGDCLTQQSHGPETLRNPEPGFFILGAKSYGRRNDFLLRVGWQQVDDVFTLLKE